MKNIYEAVKRFFVRADPEYDYYEKHFQAQTLGQKAFYLAMYFIPGVLVFVFINQKNVFDQMLQITGLSSAAYQYAIFIAVTFGFHIFVPVLVLRFVDKLSFRETLAFLNLDKFDWKGVFLVAPIFLVALVFFSYPYMEIVARPFRHLIDFYPALAIPEHSIFTSYEKMFGYSGWQIFLMLVGNHLGEELYYRGYLLKKTAFLGNINWIVNSVFFSFYHIWQIPQTFPLFGISIFFGLLMIWRKNLYVLILFHFLANYAWTYLFAVIFGRPLY